MKAATVICQQIFSILALMIFLLKILLKSASKSSFFRSGVEIRFWSYISDAVARSSIVFCNSVSADRIVMAASRLLRAVAAFNTIIVFCSWISEIVLEWLHEGCDMDLLADFLHFGASDFPSKNPFKSASKSSFFRSGVEIRFWSYNFRRRCA